jgi:hypothetical protein
MACSVLWLDNVSWLPGVISVCGLVCGFLITDCFICSVTWGSPIWGNVSVNWRTLNRNCPEGCCTLCSCAVRPAGFVLCLRVELVSDSRLVWVRSQNGRIHRLCACGNIEIVCRRGRMWRRCRLGDRKWRARVDHRVWVSSGTFTFGVLILLQVACTAHGSHTSQ